MAFKKKLYAFRPDQQPTHTVKVHYTKEKLRTQSVGKVDVEREFRQLLSDKVNGTHVGLWLLLLPHLQLGSWDLVKAWCHESDDRSIEPRIAMQMIHESALCVSGVRQMRTLRQKGFEALHGLPFVASDQTIHEILDKHTMSDAAEIQTRLSLIRRARNHYGCSIVLVDPHRIHTWTKRQFSARKSHLSADATRKVQTFFAIDAESGQPYFFDMGSTSVTASQATVNLVDRLGKILHGNALIVGDAEHFTVEIVDRLSTQQQFSFLIPMSQKPELKCLIATLDYQPHWAGYAVAESEYPFGKHKVRMIVQRTGEQKHVYKPFLTTSTMNAADLMTLVFPERWNIEEFFNIEQALGWNRAATLNMNIRYNRLSMALIAQAALYELRKMLPQEMKSWSAQSMAEKLFSRIDGDIRVRNDTIVVTFYNGSQIEALKQYYENLPKKLEQKGIDPRVPWLYNFKVDFRFC